MKRKYFLLLMALASMGMTAQNVYDIEELSGTDLNGTARYVGMGGAMGALGADLSVTGTNPAGTALMRRSDISLTMGVNNTPKGCEFYDRQKTKFSLDQAGCVFVMNTYGDVLQNVNLAINYHKERNFNQNLSAEGQFAGGALSQLREFTNLDSKDYYNPLTTAASEMGLCGYDRLAGTYWNLPTNGYAYKRAQWGYNNAFDINLSANISNQIYAGMTIGVKSLEYHQYSEYEEYLNGGFVYNLAQDRYLHGSGADVKLGVILRPIESSPFRVGLSFTSPTFYTLKTSNIFGFIANINGTEKRGSWVDPGTLTSSVNTPWKMNVSLGHTIAGLVALGAEYEYTGQHNISVKYNEGWTDGWHHASNYYTDGAVKEEAKHVLCTGTHTVKGGMEVRLTPQFSIRTGVNYITSAFNKSQDEAYRNEFINSYTHEVASGTEYMNKSDIWRYTFGFGYRGTNWYADAVYQYQEQEGTFYPNDIEGMTAQKASLDRQQFQMTIGYKF